MSEDPRIAQFKQMAEADPDNELGHFSLAKAYLDADRPQDAIKPLERALELNPKLSKAFQLLGEAYDRSGRRAEAIEVVTRGVTTADRLGDRMPREAMIGLLKDWGAPIPELVEAQRPAATETVSDAGATGFRCARCGQPRGRLEKPPFKGALGEKIFAGVCSTCWKEWIPMGTKVINELSLVLSTPAGQDAYDQYMVEFLQIEG